MESVCQTAWIIFSFLLYMLDQGTDALTALLFFLDVSFEIFSMIFIICLTIRAITWRAS